jgi:hypothetical protein
MPDNSIGRACYYVLQDRLDGEVRMWTENGLIVVEYDTLTTIEEIIEKSA